MRSFAAVLFRRVSTKTRKDPTSGITRELFMSLPQQEQFAIRGMLLQTLPSEPKDDVRRKIGDAIAEIARQYVDEGRSLT